MQCQFDLQPEIGNGVGLEIDYRSFDIADDALRRLEFTKHSV
jgi:hypothetical protein